MYNTDKDLKSKQRKTQEGVQEEFNKKFKKISVKILHIKYTSF